MSKKLVIIGAGGVGREIAAALKCYPIEGYQLIGFIDDGQQAGSIINGLQILGNMQWIIDNDNDLGVIIAIGNPQIREKIVRTLKSTRVTYPVLIGSNVNIHDPERVKIGLGCYIADGCILTTDIVIGDFCFLNTACTLQHDTVVGNYCVLMPGVRITGGATIGNATYISPNCIISSNVVLEDNRIIKESIV